MMVDDAAHSGSRIQLALTAMVLTLAGLLGGGQGGVGDSIVQLSALALAAWMSWTAMRHGLQWSGPSWVRWLPVMLLMLPVLQLLPIPEVLWTTGAARSELAGQLLRAGATHPSVLSLHPAATERALWSLLPACAIFLSVLVLPPSTRRWLLGIVVLLALANFLLGLFQLADGQDSGLRFYHPTNASNAVGFFANSNHLASLMVMALPLALVATAWCITERLAGREVSLAWPPLLIVAIVLITLAIALSRSRAGLLLGMVALLGALPIILSLRRQRGTRRLLAVVLGLAFVLTVQFALFGILQRLQADPLDDGRWHYAQVTREAAHAYAPFGSGYGTFRQAYQPFEARSVPQDEIVNHAHNDYLEAWMEGGWAAIAAMLLAGIAWIGLGVHLWRRGPAPGERGHSDRVLARTTWLAASMALLHSALDYPLRTTANMSVFALLAAVAFSGWSRRRRDSAG